MYSLRSRSSKGDVKGEFVEEGTGSRVGDLAMLRTVQIG